MNARQFTPSRYQATFFNWVQTGAGNAILQALAGSGKSTTIVRAMSLIPSSQRVLFLAFNKAIADELQNRAPAHAECRTFNALGAWMLLRLIGRSTIDAKKLEHLAGDLFTHDDRMELGQDAVKLARLAKAYAFSPVATAANDWPMLIDRFGMTALGNDRLRLIEMAGELLTASHRETGVIDFDDQIYVPVMAGAPAPVAYDWIMVDEAQDVSPIQRKLLQRIMGPRTRLVAVGDQHQAIYGFRGSDSNSMLRIKDEFTCAEMPLSICYRCPTKVIAEAKRLVPAIEAAATAPAGDVRTLDWYTPSDLNEATDLIICRNTQPLITLAYRCIREGVNVRVLGREIGKGLINIIRRQAGRSITRLRGQAGFVVKLQAWSDREIENLRAEDQQDKADAVRDRVQTILTVVEATDCDSVDALIRAIDDLFSRSEGVTFCTIHKSKGLEARRVFILDRHLLPAKSARQDWQIEQERNLEYVAITRAQHQLIYIESNPVPPALSKDATTAARAQEEAA